MQEQACLCHGPCVGIHALTFLFIRGRVSLLSAPAHTSQLASDSLIGSQTLQMHATTSGIYVGSGSWTQALKLHGRCSAHQVDPQPGPSVLVFLSRDMISGRASPHPLLLCFIMKRWLHMAPAVFYLKSIKTDGKVGRGRERGSVTQAHRNKDPEW